MLCLFWRNNKLQIKDSSIALRTLKKKIAQKGKEMCPISGNPFPPWKLDRLINLEEICWAIFETWNCELMGQSGIAWCLGTLRRSWLAGCVEIVHIMLFSLEFQIVLLKSSISSEVWRETQIFHGLTILLTKCIKADLSVKSSTKMICYYKYSARHNYNTKQNSSRQNPYISDARWMHFVGINGRRDRFRQKTFEVQWQTDHILPFILRFSFLLYRMTWLSLRKLLSFTQNASVSRSISNRRYPKSEAADVKISSHREYQRGILISARWTRSKFFSAADNNIQKTEIYRFSSPASRSPEPRDGPKPRGNWRGWLG
jgi:hypothetical protein